MISNKGYEYLYKAMNGELENGTIIKTKHKSQYFDDYQEYDYYIYRNDGMFHRCNEQGKLGAKYQDRFLNYKVLNKNFEFDCVLATEEDNRIEKFSTEYTYSELDFEIINYLNRLRDKINKLKENQNDRKYTEDE